jgi:hypothetical protein
VTSLQNGEHDVSELLSNFALKRHLTGGTFFKAARLMATSFPIIAFEVFERDRLKYSSLSTTKATTVMKIT